jgi:hypothetical protein
MELYSYKRKEPTELPERINIFPHESESGLKETRTSLCELCQEELENLGFTKVEIPTYDDQNFKLVWNETSCIYDIVELTEQEKQSIIAINQSKLEEERTIDWINFESRFIQLEVFKKLFTSGIQYLIQMASDMRALVVKARYNDPEAFLFGSFNVRQVLEILSIINVAGITQEDRDIFINNCVQNNLDKSVFIPSEEWRSKHYFELSDAHLQYHSSSWGHYTHCVKSTGEDVFT